MSVDGAAREWLDALFLQKCLQRINDGREINVIDFQVAGATNKGENYAGELVRVTVRFTDDKNSASIDDADRKCKPLTCNLIVKTLVSGELALKALGDLNVCVKEMKMYDTILPQMKTLLCKAGVTRKMFADTIYVSELHNAILFEDLSIAGYRNVIGKDGLDMALAKATLSKLAKFHAAAAVLHEQQPDLFKEFSNGMIDRQVDTLNVVQQTMFAEAIRLTSEWPDFTYYTEKLRKFEPYLIESEYKAFDSSADGFNTLTHGDLWFTNLMLRYDGDQLDNIALIDFQFGSWTSPTIDLHYFLNTSMMEDIQMNHQTELVQYYHKKLVEMLTSLNYRRHIPSLLEFQIEFLARSIWGFASACLISPVQLTDQCDDADINALLGTDERAINFKRHAIRMPHSQAKLRKLIPKYERLGFFDVPGDTSNQRQQQQ